MPHGKLKPLARARRSAALQHHSRAVLSRSCEEALFRFAEVLSEGGCRPDPKSHDSYFGSTMLSVDFSRLRDVVREDLDEPGRALLASVVEGSVRVRLRAMRLAMGEAARRAPEREFGTAMCEIRVHLTDASLHIDVDLEVPLGVSSGSRAR